MSPSIEYAAFPCYAQFFQLGDQHWLVDEPDVATSVNECRRAPESLVVATNDRNEDLEAQSLQDEYQQMQHADAQAELAQTEQANLNQQSELDAPEWHPLDQHARRARPAFRPVIEFIADNFPPVDDNRGNSNDRRDNFPPAFRRRQFAIVAIVMIAILEYSIQYVQERQSSTKKQRL